MPPLDRSLALFHYNAAVDLAMHSFIPEIRTASWKRARAIAKELGMKESGNEPHPN